MVAALNAITEMPVFVKTRIAQLTRTLLGRLLCLLA